jgi:hypothetical protein
MGFNARTAKSLFRMREAHPFSSKAAPLPKIQAIRFAATVPEWSWCAQSAVQEWGPYILPY